ncbi:MAG TPA: N,N-dimethylformamidase beta subunit family domain-containing protein, partial [Labilithrix sp.]|nr:N,N-dimethylformamidase beta subunit family domain-containing protein [Labilithrix sp.]
MASENGLPGTTDWVLTSPATQREIEGYASATSVAPGGKIRFFVSTASPRYTVDVYRLGWYAGKGGRAAQATVERDGHLQIAPVPDADGLVECDWTDPYELTVPTAWVTGMYLVKLTTKGSGKQSYIPFVV